jgi:hypothetical protein
MRPSVEQAAGGPLMTPDGRYIVVRGRLWRRSNPKLTPDHRDALVHALMSARRAVRDALNKKDADALRQARSGVQAAKVGLGERGPVWWTDGAPDFNRHMARTTPYAAWFASLPDTSAN